MKRVLSVLLALCLLLGAVPLYAGANSEDFVIENGVVTKYNGPGGHVVIPSGVTGIGSTLFFMNNTITSVVIPEGVTSIGWAAFSNCNNLVSVSLPDSLLSLDGSAFGECASLTEINIPAKVTALPADLFFKCTNLMKVTLPEGLKTIGDAAFSQCFQLTALDIPKSVFSIGEEAFYRCTGLTSIQIPEGITSVPKRCFWACTSLQSVQLPASLMTIGDSAFYNCAITEITLPEQIKSIGSSAFSNCESLVSVVIPEGITTLKDHVFSGCSGLTSITLPKSLRTIERGALGIMALKNIFYAGSESEWAQISIGDFNDEIANATIYYNGETAPAPTPEPTPEPTEEPTPTPEPTEEPTPTPEPTEEPTPTPEPTEEPTPTPDPTEEPTPTPEPTDEPTPTPAPPAFTDVGERDWFAVSVAWAVQNNITSGKGSSSTFKPHDTCTRAEIMTFIWASEGRPSPSAPADFVDMPSLPAFRSAISWAVEQGVTSGMGGGKFGATMPCTRVQAVTFLWAAAGRPQPTATAAFSDMTGNSVYDAAISWAVENRITTGAGNNRFNPGKRCSRAEIVTFLRAASAEKS